MNWREWELEDFLWTGLITLFLPRCVSLLPSFPTDTHQCQEYYKWKCFFLFFGRILSIAPVFF